jgi:beta-lactam-binding protein with PASTA domain
MGDSHYHGQGPGWFAVLFISLVTSSAVVAGFQWATARGFLPPALTPAAQTGTAPQAAAPSGESVKVPVLVGLPVLIAGELLEARGLRLVVREKRAHEVLPAEAIIEQEPLADSAVPRESAVSVVVSNGKAATVLVPELVGKTLDEAKQALKDAELTLGALSGAAEGDRAVQKSDPEAQTAVTRGSAVQLVMVATGVEVPKLVGMPFGKAKKAIEQAGLTVGKVRETFDDYKDPWVVLQQTPEPGARVAKGATIDLVRNEGD